METRNDQIIEMEMKSVEKTKEKKEIEKAEKKKQTEKPIRCFFAIMLDAKTQQTLHRATNTIATHINPKSIHWIKPENWHITLRFLGATDPKQIPTIITHVADAIASFKPFEIKLGPILSFPSTQHPHHLTPLVSPEIELQQLAMAVENAVVDLDFPKETRDFRGHINLGKIKTRHFHCPHLDNDPLIKKPLVLRVNEIRLLQSVTKPEGAVYTCLQRFWLGADSSEKNS